MHQCICMLWATNEAYLSLPPFNSLGTSTCEPKATYHDMEQVFSVSNNIFHGTIVFWEILIDIIK